MKRNHDLVLEGRRLIAETIALPLPAPDEMVGLPWQPWCSPTPAALIQVAICPR